MFRTRTPRRIESNYPEPSPARNPLAGRHNLQGTFQRQRIKWCCRGRPGRQAFPRIHRHERGLEVESHRALSKHIVTGKSSGLVNSSFIWTVSITCHNSLLETNFSNSWPPRAGCKISLFCKFALTSPDTSSTSRRPHRTPRMPDGSPRSSPQGSSAVWVSSSQGEFLHHRSLSGTELAYQRFAPSLETRPDLFFLRIPAELSERSPSRWKPVASPNMERPRRARPDTARRSR